MEVLRRLAETRPVFHSEADFQHAYAWEMQLMHPEARVRLEYRHTSMRARSYLDIWVESRSAPAAIELKYKTRGLRVEHLREQFALLDQGAQDQGRYDFCRDLSRVEEVVRLDPTARGLAIFLTNDSSYWRPKSRLGTVDEQFRLCDQSVLHGELQWLSHASDGTKDGRQASLDIRGEYRLDWQHYASVPAAKRGEFKFLVLEA